MDTTASDADHKANATLAAIRAQPGTTIHKAGRINSKAHLQAMYSIQTTEPSEADLAHYTTSTADTLAH